jgi:hypothetical protein
MSATIALLLAITVLLLTTGVLSATAILLLLLLEMLLPPLLLWLCCRFPMWLYVLWQQDNVVFVHFGAFGNHSRWVWRVNHFTMESFSAQQDDPRLSLYSKIWVGKCGGNDMVMDPSAHPQHMNIVKHIVHA